MTKITAERLERLQAGFELFRAELGEVMLDGEIADAAGLTDVEDISEALTMALSHALATTLSFGICCRQHAAERIALASQNCFSMMMTQMTQMGFSEEEHVTVQVELDTKELAEAESTEEVDVVEVTIEVPAGPGRTVH